MTIEEYNTLPNHFFGTLKCDTPYAKISPPYLIIGGEWIKTERNNIICLKRIHRWSGHILEGENWNINYVTVLKISEELNNEKLQGTYR